MKRTISILIFLLCISAMGYSQVPTLRQVLGSGLNVQRLPAAATLTVSPNDTLIVFTSSGWKKTTASLFLSNGGVTSVAIAPANGFTVSGSPITSTGTITLNTDAVRFASSPMTIASNTITIPKATNVNSGYLSNTDWVTFNNKQQLLVSGSNIKTINGNSILGSGNISISGGSNNTFNSPLVDNAGVVSINQSSSGSSGYLSSTDWTTFNNKQATLVSGVNIKTINGSSILGSGNISIGGGGGSYSFNSPLTESSGSVSINQANTSNNGFLSSTDWNTFNNKVSNITAGSNVTVNKVGTSYTISATGGGGGGGDEAMFHYDATPRSTDFQTRKGILFSQDIPKAMLGAGQIIKGEINFVMSKTNAPFMLHFGIIKNVSNGTYFKDVEHYGMNSIISDIAKMEFTLYGRGSGAADMIVTITPSYMGQENNTFWFQVDYGDNPRFEIIGESGNGYQQLSSLGSIMWRYGTQPP